MGNPCRDRVVRGRDSTPARCPRRASAAQRRSRRLEKTDAVDAVASARALLAEPTLGPVQTLEVNDPLVAKIEAVLEQRRALGSGPHTGFAPCRGPDLQAPHRDPRPAHQRRQDREPAASPRRRCRPMLGRERSRAVGCACGPVRRCFAFGQLTAGGAVEVVVVWCVYLGRLLVRLSRRAGLGTASRPAGSSVSPAIPVWSFSRRSGGAMWLVGWGIVLMCVTSFCLSVSLRSGSHHRFSCWRD